MALTKKAMKCDARMEAAKNPMIFAEAVMRSLAHKGFAVVDAAPDAGLLEKALADAKQLEEDGRFEMPPPEIIGGLLGEEGSAHVCEAAVSADEEGGSAPSLKKLDGCFTELATSLLPMAAAELGTSIESRTASMLHRSGEAFDDDAPALTEVAADTWLGQFVKQRLMVLYFLGPGDGKLELQPFRHEDAPPVEVPTTPGMVVVLRTDALLPKFSAPKASLTLTCWLNKDSLDAVRTDYNDETIAPYAKSLLTWMMARLRQIKHDEVMGEYGPEWNEDIPRNWQSVMNHAYFMGPQTAIRSCAVHFPSDWDCFASWASLQAGADFGVYVPFSRWDHEPSYDPNPQSWKWSKCCSKHGSFMEGAELFDPKPYGLSVFEAKGMDVCQRQILETSYEALIEAGFTKKSLMRGLLGCYIGATQTEFGLVPAIEGATATGAAGAITSNRISFCLGMQGPSLTIDTGGASALAALSQSTNSLRYQTDKYVPNHAAVAGAVALSLATGPYLLACAAGFMNPGGRAFTYDVSAAGWCKGEGSGSMVSDKCAEVVDGEEIQDDGKPVIANLGAISMNHGGASARLCAPSGPQQKELVSMALRQASISPLDVDALECHGDGSILNDSVEVSGQTQVFRGEGPPEPIFVSSACSNLGFGMECSGMYQVMKVLTMQRMGVQTPGIHLHELNPHIDVWEGQPINFTTEILQFKQLSSFVGITGRSYTGTMAHAIPWKNTDFGIVRPRKQVVREAIAFWPGGGGELEDGAAPSRNYTITGSWSEWSKPDAMKKEAGGAYTFVVTLGVNRFEHFQVRLDGDRDRVLHPEFPDAGPNAAVMGPSEKLDSDGFCWMIDGRPKYAADPAAIEDDGPGIEGYPGDEYRVRVRVAGKWRTVDWARDDTGIAERQKRWDAYVDGGAYYVCASWNGWGFTEMAKEGGSHSLEVKLKKNGGEFVIVRNQDLNQAFYFASAGGSKVVGPALTELASNCVLYGKPGDTAKIVFTRSKDEATISY
mmetsp:Transcript_24516/g.68892  ORF Transcript_24516/g.68892 Transcript_24516/m.68892 type:complete len:999 (-) Transcript_24516:69-3065(-)